MTSSLAATSELEQDNTFSPPLSPKTEQPYSLNEIEKSLSEIPLDTIRKQVTPSEHFLILNDLVVDRGPSAYMSQLELFVDENHLTTVQADGLVISTPTGSTAYSVQTC